MSVAALPTVHEPADIAIDESHERLSVGRSVPKLAVAAVLRGEA